MHAIGTTLINKRKAIILLAAAAFMSGLYSCSKEVKSQPELTNDSIAQIQKDSIIHQKMEEAVARFPQINYQKIKLRDRNHLNALLKMTGTKQDSIDRKKIIMLLNRKELKYIGGGSTIIVPDTFIADNRAYSVFPQFYEAAVDIPKIIMVSNMMQSYACYEYGNLVRFAAANTGKERTPSYPGRYSLVWREYKRKSSVNEYWILPYTFNFHNEAGSAFHQFDMPGRPVSHSCIRQFMDDAKWLFHWGKGCAIDTNRRFIPMSGTPVIIVDHYDFSRKTGLWTELTSNNDHILELPDDPMAIEEALIPISQIPKTSRGVLRNKERYITAEDTLRARGIIRPNVKLTPSIDYNKLRRQKAAAKAKKLKEQQMLQNQGQQ